MTFRLAFLLVIITLITSASTVSAQVDSVIGQVSNSGAETFAGGMSGNGRFVVFESRGDIATENPRNSDNNTEIFLFDYAQRRIFQITDTKSVLFNTTLAPTFNNIRVEITNTRPVISNDGKWIAFSSNATSSVPTQTPNGTNPGLFDGNAFTSLSPSPSASPTATATGSPTGSPTATPSPGPNLLTDDANLEMWLFELPPYKEIADLSAGDEITITNLSNGIFTQVTNTPASQFPRAGTQTTGPFVADDNHDATISDDGAIIAFVSTRDLVLGGNPAPPPLPGEDNDEIFTFLKDLGPEGTLGQVTRTERGLISNPIYNKNPTISGNGARVAFASTGDDPIDDPLNEDNFDTGSNPESSRNEEIFYADLVAGVPTGGRQITTTTPTNPGDPVNVLDLGRRMSRDGRYIAFESYADLGTSGANRTSFALYLYDTQFPASTPSASPTATATASPTGTPTPPNNSPFRQIGPRSDADTAAFGGDLQHYPTFTDYGPGGTGTATTLVFETRLNIKADGTIPTTAADGLNPDPSRPAQIYAYPLNVPTATATFTRLAKFPPAALQILGSTQLIPSNSRERMAFNFSLSELGTGNFDLRSEVFYYLLPDSDTETPVTTAFSTGATRQAVSINVITPSPSGTPSSSPTNTSTATSTPTSTPTSTATSTPTGTPSGSPTGSASASATPTATPQTPSSVLGISPGMLAILDYQAGIDRPLIARTAVGSIQRSFSLPIELSGLTMTINGAACGLKSVSRRRIEFVVPPGLGSFLTGTNYPLVINNNGLMMRSSVTIVPARPDIFNKEGTIGPGGRAKLFNVTNTVQTTEPFTYRTIKRKGNKLVPTVLRIYATGVANLDAASITVRIRNVSIRALTGPILVEPGVYTFDFELPPALRNAGDQPVVVIVSGGNVAFSSRLDDTTSRVFIL